MSGGVVSDPGRNVKVGVKDLGHIYIETHVSIMLGCG